MSDEICPKMEFKFPLPALLGVGEQVFYSFSYKCS